VADRFVHAHASHCESGVMSSLLSHNGLPISEAMAFGLASALSFAYLPFVRINGLPLVSFRMPPRAIVRGLRRGLGLNMKFETFRRPRDGSARLDALLDEGKLVGLQASVFWLPYFPPDLRFHFNAHNLLAYGREGDQYLISDPVGETTVRCPRTALEKARFARGALAPKGLLYYLTSPPETPDWARLGKRALARTVRIMLAPFPFFGLRGMETLANRVRALSLADGGEHARMYIGNIVRMQEEIGTGGGGFRFLYASFLQELGARTGYAALEKLAPRMVEIGDRWREFALASAHMIRGRDALAPPALATRLRALAVDERRFYRDLLVAARAWKC
jgi:hypothetical protein